MSLCANKYTGKHMPVTIVNQGDKFLRCDKDYYHKGQLPLYTNEENDDNWDQFNYSVIEQLM